MTQESAHHPSGSLTLAAALAATAGFVDAHIYVHVTPVFVANMSGNLIHLGIFVGLGGVREMLGSSAALIAFFCGVVSATTHHDRQLRRAGAVGPGFLLTVEAVLILSLPIVLTLLDVHFDSRTRAAHYPVIVIAAFAMGLQASALRRVGSVAVATTYGTGAIVRIGEKFGLAARRADRAGHGRRRVTIVVLVAVLLSYVGGAVSATALGSSRLLLLIPGGALAVAAFALRNELPAESPAPE